MAIFKKITLLFLFAGIIGFSYIRSQKETSGGDFHVFWKSGINLLDGKSLYQSAPGEREFLYPPFAALFFVPFSLLPFKISAFIFYLLNFLLWGASFYLIYKIFTLYFQNKPLIRNGLIFSFLTSFKLFWNNIMMVQCNEIVFFICLLGIFLFLRGKENWAIFFFALATSVKVWPVFFFFWVLIRGKRLSFFKSLGWGILLTSLPFLFGGINKGIGDLGSFFKVLSGFSGPGITGITYANQSLGYTIFRLFTTYAPDNGKYLYTIWDLGPENANLIFKISFAGILFLMITSLIYAKKIGNKLLIIEPCIIFLGAHLLSGKCFKAHLVSLSLIYMTIFIMTFSNIKGHLSIWSKFIMGFALFLAFTGKELYGEKVQYFIGGYGFYTWIMIFSLGFLISTLMLNTKEEKLRPH